MLVESRQLLNSRLRPCLSRNSFDQSHRVLHLPESISFPVQFIREIIPCFDLQRIISPVQPQMGRRLAQCFNTSRPPRSCKIASHNFSKSFVDHSMIGTLPVNDSLITYGTRLRCWFTLTATKHGKQAQNASCKKQNRSERVQRIDPHLKTSHVLSFCLTWITGTSGGMSMPSSSR